MFAALTTFLATHHEMWRDEVRAFSIATRAATWGSLLGDLHNEGHPALWYIVLRAGFAMTHSNLVLPVLALVIGLATAYVVLRYAPFPFWLRLLMVFGAFLGYEYSVVARNYGIGVLLLLIACVLFQTREQHGIALGSVLALMANTSVHAAAASVVIVLIWGLDFIDSDRRRRLLRVGSLAGIAIALVGAALAISSASPTADMSYAQSFRQLDARGILESIANDPGNGLRGVYIGGLWHADLAAAGELPWALAGISSGAASRIVVDLCLLFIGWALTPSRRHLAAAILAVLGFEVMFSGVYPAALRHQGILAFLLVAICWIAVRDRRDSGASSFGRRVAFGLLPLMAVQSIALPVIVRRQLVHPASSSKALAGVIKATPRLSNAILMSEPDYMMEPLPYYVQNPVYMPRQREYHYRVYFDNGGRRQRDLSLGNLLFIADSIGCSSRRPILLSIASPGFLTRPSGEVPGVFHGSLFRWSAADKARLTATTRLLGDFEGATTDENYQVFEITPRPVPECAAGPPVSHEGAL